MSPRDPLDVAAALITGIHEAEWRSAVSRAYYAVFHAARDLLRQCGFAVPNGDQAHGYLWLRLANAGHPDVKQAGVDVQELRKGRNRADYDLDLTIAHKTALGYVELADTIFAVMEIAAGEPGVCATITEAMKVYERDVLKQVTWHA
jgi:uncharacterized protein (UPF0332 family)